MVSRVGEHGEVARSLDGAGERPLALGAHARLPAGLDLGLVGEEASEEVDVLVVDLLALKRKDISAAVWGSTFREADAGRHPAVPDREGAIPLAEGLTASLVEVPAACPVEVPAACSDPVVELSRNSSPSSHLNGRSYGYQGRSSAPSGGGPGE